MKDKEIKIRADDGFLKEVDYLQEINGFKNRSDTIRRIIYKEYFKERFTIISPLDEPRRKWERSGAKEPLTIEDIRQPSSGDPMIDELARQREEIIRKAMEKEKEDGR